MINASIVTYKTNLAELNRAINSIVDFDCLNKLYVIDNSPTNDLQKEFNKPSKIEYIYTGKNLGYGAAHNIAIYKSIADQIDYHLVLNPDVYFDPEIINTLIHYLDSNLSAGQVMPKILYPNNEIQYLCKLLPTPFNLIFRRFSPFKRYNKYLEQKYELRFTGYNKQMNVPYLSGCFMFFRVSVLKEIGVFDERFFMYPEDVDITRRIHEKYDTVFFPDVFAYHDHAKESYKSLKMTIIHIYNMVKYFNKWGWFFDKKRVFFNKRFLISAGWKK